MHMYCASRLSVQGPVEHKENTSFWPVGTFSKYVCAQGDYRTEEVESLEDHLWEDGKLGADDTDLVEISLILGRRLGTTNPNFGCVSVVSICLQMSIKVLIFLII